MPTKTATGTAMLMTTEKHFRDINTMSREELQSKKSWLQEQLKRMREYPEPLNETSTYLQRLYCALLEIIT